MFFFLSQPFLSSSSPSVHLSTVPVSLFIRCSAICNVPSFFCHLCHPLHLSISVHAIFYPSLPASLQLSVLYFLLPSVRYFNVPLSFQFSSLAFISHLFDIVCPAFFFPPPLSSSPFSLHPQMQPSQTSRVDLGGVTSLQVTRLSGVTASHVR